MDRANSDLSTFVGTALADGISRTAIRNALLQAGWQNDRIERALGDYAELDFPLPVPRPKPYLSAREAFFYLLLFATLYISAFNFGNLLFVFIEHAFPDPALEEITVNWNSQRIRSAISALIVAFPVFLYLSGKINRELLSSPAGRASAIRRWLTYITLFIASGIIIGDLIAILYNFLGGELTTRFILKSLTIGILAGTLFFHYINGLRREEQEP
ncbi:MAG: DUF5671 domain-containing protein [Chlorobium sp.]|uniref:DUF5671 domain-containing protein n=1 Tax=Chlorobium sp. TaxID=1095 RepID=UPI0025C52B78|nr:DUF5671 domain-containing protein [Chlorobium sp.]MCF8383695.1 DUF5671 domain-containing protein [Chlorobium sp.]